eukprot:TRINITY_DN21890_c0_g1_i3.p1 TRINITY_DN21890_c0_g1~~TRINITY_DN21890_c0_g1_i3.p1  ORF type:complete len:326 (-),score=25.45 TRINITY_DN21890_c0_g1_i3:156-1133(-)
MYQAHQHDANLGWTHSPSSSKSVRYATIETQMPDVAKPAEGVGFATVDLADERRRLSQAAISWLCEALTLLLTLLYCGIAAYDRRQGEAYLTSASWFAEGFCISRFRTTSSYHFSSHTLCFLLDVVVGVWLTKANVDVACRCSTPPLMLAVAVSIFTVLHGWGHLIIGHVLPLEFQDAFNVPTDYPFSRFICQFTGMGMFLSMGPYVGYLHGVRSPVCVLLHILTTLGYVMFVPVQLAFTVVQLLLNLWICTPRVLWLTDFNDKSVVARRIDGGGIVISVGMLLLMPVVFVEMLACDSYAAALGGHVLYDASVCMMALVYSVSLW